MPLIAVNCLTNTLHTAVLFSAQVCVYFSTQVFDSCLTVPNSSVKVTTYRFALQQLSVN